MPCRTIISTEKYFAGQCLHQSLQRQEFSVPKIILGCRKIMQHILQNSDSQNAIGVLCAQNLHRMREYNAAYSSEFRVPKWFWSY